MQTIYISIKCELGRTYEVADAYTVIAFKTFV